MQRFHFSVKIIATNGRPHQKNEKHKQKKTKTIDLMNVIKNSFDEYYTESRTLTQNAPFLNEMSQLVSLAVFTWLAR